MYKTQKQKEEKVSTQSLVHHVICVCSVINVVCYVSSKHLLPSVKKVVLLDGINIHIHQMIVVLTLVLILPLFVILDLYQ